MLMSGQSDGRELPTSRDVIGGLPVRLVVLLQPLTGSCDVGSSRILESLWGGDRTH